MQVVAIGAAVLIMLLLPVLSFAAAFVANESQWLSPEFLHFLLRNPDVSPGLSFLVVESSLL